MAPTTTASPSQIQGQREGVPELFVDANLFSFPAALSQAAYFSGGGRLKCK
jgi:hypothetical protein